MISSIAKIICCALIIFSTQTLAAHKVIVAFGDSITKGWPYWPENLRGARGGAYPSRLENLIRLNHPEHNIRIHNWGEGGETTSHAIGRLESVLNISRPSTVLLMIGTNDLWTGISPHTTAANIGAMINIVRRAGADPVVSNLTPSNYPGHPGERINTMYNPAIENVIALSGAKFNDAYSIFRQDWSTLSSDGLHMNEVGYHMLADSWCDLMDECRIAEPESPSELPFINILLLGD